METERKPRGDHPGAWHHVTNRGLARRPAFEGRSDVRAFLALIAMRVREGQIELHAYCILTTHFHLLIRSTMGELSNAMMWIENRYVKYFNRLRDRDGSLFRSRFRSRIIDTDEYWFNVIRYIDANAVEAGLCETSAEYEFGSARMYCGARAAIWLETSAVERTVARLSRARAFDPRDYQRLFASRLDPDDAWILERRLERGMANSGGDERGNELLQMAPAHVLEWLRARAELADGGSIGLTLAAPAQVERVVRVQSAADPGWCCRRAPKGTRAWRTLEIGLLRWLCGLSLQGIADRTRVSRSGVWLLCRLHLEWLVADPVYSERAAGVVAGLERAREAAARRERAQEEIVARG